ncbi:MAG: hypothetical protein AAF192_13765 [Pseudomonadota bacterium]
MKRVFAAVAGLMLAACTAPPAGDAMVFEERQVWRAASGDGKPPVVFVIALIEDGSAYEPGAAPNDRIVHVSMFDEDHTMTVHHAPFDIRALAATDAELLNQSPQVGRKFADGLAIWRRRFAAGEGAVWNLPVPDAFWEMEHVRRNGTRVELET